MQRVLRKVLVSVDGSDGSRRALDFALSIAGSAEAMLTVLEIEPAAALVASGQQGSSVPSVPAGIAHLAYRIEESYPALEGTRVHWRPMTATGVGDPADEIRRVAMDGHYDLVIIAHEGHDATGPNAPGSVFERVVREVPCSVTVVR